MRTFLAAYAIAFLLLLSPCFGQTPGTGAISGIVYDPATRAVANAEVSAVNEATGVSRSVATSSEGVFRVPLLLPGSYALTVNAGGFADRIKAFDPGDRKPDQLCQCDVSDCRHEHGCAGE